jgi:hypothetical protein
MGLVGKHVGEHQRAQDAPTVSLWNDATDATRSLTKLRPRPR